MKKVKLKRNIRSSDQVSNPPKRPVTQIVEESHARQILHLPEKQRKILLTALKEGNPVSSISRYFSEQGWLKVSETTFTQYIMSFRRVYPDMCEGNDDASIDSIVDGKRPSLDEEQEYERLYRLQKVRLKVGVDFETNTGFPNKDLHKDVQMAKEILDSLSTVRGKRSGAGRPNANSTAVGAGAAEALRAADIGEAAQERMVNAVAGLVGLVSGKNSAKTQA
jgi:hypothetical protein